MLGETHRYVLNPKTKHHLFFFGRTAKFIMSYPPPPGPQTSSLPPRPPPSRVSGFKPAYSPAGSHSHSHSHSQPPTHTPSPGPYGAPGAPPPAYSSAPNYAGAPATHAHSQYGAPPSSYHQPYAHPGSVSGGGGGGYQQPPPSNPYGQYPGQPSGGAAAAAAGGYGQNYYGSAPQGTGANAANAAATSYAAPPQIRNPFPAPSQAKANDDYDLEMAAQIAQWQSAYVKDPTKDGAAPPSRSSGNGATTTYAAESTSGAAAAAAASASASAVPGSTDKKKTVVRQGGGQKWTDDTLLEWDPSHLRLFVGNLAGETTDESLYKAFASWKSLQKARVIRDKVTSKSKGYGFVSFSDPDEFFAAAKEMNGKYIQSHPVVVRKSTTEIKPTAQRDGGRWGKGGRNGKGKGKNKGGNGGGGKREGSSEPHLGPVNGGVHKPGQKTKGGLKLLG